MFIKNIMKERKNVNLQLVTIRGVSSVNPSSLHKISSVLSIATEVILFKSYKNRYKKYRPSLIYIKNFKI